MDDLRVQNLASYLYYTGGNWPLVPTPVYHKFSKCNNRCYIITHCKWKLASSNQLTAFRFLFEIVFLLCSRLHVGGFFTLFCYVLWLVGLCHYFPVRVEVVCGQSGWEENCALGTKLCGQFQSWNITYGQDKSGLKVRNFYIKGNWSYICFLNQVCVGHYLLHCWVCDPR